MPYKIHRSCPLCLTTIKDLSSHLRQRHKLSPHERRKFLVKTTSQHTETPDRENILSSVLDTNLHDTRPMNESNHTVFVEEADCTFSPAKQEKALVMTSAKVENYIDLLQQFLYLPLFEKKTVSSKQSTRFIHNNVTRDTAQR